MDEQLFYGTCIMPLIAEMKCFSGMLSGKCAVLSSWYFMHLRVDGQTQIIGYFTVNIKDIPCPVCLWKQAVVAGYMGRNYQQIVYRV